MKIENLIEVLPESYSVIDRDAITRAYKLAESAHSKQIRASGEPYITHCLAVAKILAELRVPPAVVVAAILHDTVEDTTVTLDILRQEFGDEVTSLVDGVTKLTNLPRVTRDDSPVKEISEVNEIEIFSKGGEGKDLGGRRKKYLENETLRKTFLAMGDDIRVILIKLADRLHNMRTLGYISEHKRKRIAQETLDIFAPLANRLGIWQIKWELEDLAFRYTDPDKFKEIAESLAGRKADRDSQILNITERLKTLLDQVDIKVEITGRSKHIYSIYRKMMEKEKPFDMVLDLRAVRLIVPDIPSCYAALGVIHTHWRPIPHEFDDYIAAPKDNFYQSLHTAVIYDDGKPLEVQIRTREMHQNAEYGIAAHWRYKEKGKRDEDFDKRITWLRNLMEWEQDVVDAQEFVDSMKTDVFQDRVFVFTPKGDIYDLPNGSTPIDFAYHVHTEIGHHCRGAKVNGKQVPLDYILKTGDQVSILTTKHGGPSRDWLNTNLGLVKTQRSRIKIRQWFKKQDREQNTLQGKIMFERELQRLGMHNFDLEKLFQSLDFRTIEDFYAALGCGDISFGRIVNKLSEVERERDPFLEPITPTEVKDDGHAITVVGLKGLLFNFARCCNPVPGDEIVGYITRGRGATVHRQDCPNILRSRDQERIVKVSWGEPHQTYPVSVRIKAYDRQGLMGDISSVLKDEGVNINDVDVKVNHNLAAINITIEIGDIAQLSRVLTRIETLPNIMEAHRMKPG